MKNKLSALIGFFKGLSILDWLRVIAMTIIGLSAMSCYRPLEEWIRSVYEFRYPTMLPNTISFLIIAATEAALFVLLSKKFSMWLFSVVQQVLIAVGFLIWVLIKTQELFSVLIIGYLFVMPIGYSWIIQFFAVEVKQFFQSRLKKWAYPICYGICAVLLATAFLLPYTQPSTEQLCKELNRFLKDPEIYNLEWSYYSEDNEMERISDEQWEDILSKLQVTTTRPDQTDHIPSVEGRIDMGFSTKKQFHPFSKNISLYWMSEYNSVRIEYRGETFYVDCSEFEKCIEEYITPASE
ncbi:MAG: hypothetical protein J6R82_03990 [Clostridia bacterium]|nr:hypothetical protein [Clostridia bacterium]